MFIQLSGRVSDRRIARSEEPLNLKQEFDLEAQNRIPPFCIDIVARMAKGGYMMHTICQTELGTALLTSVRFYKEGEKEIHVQSTNIEEAYRFALREAHDRWRRSRAEAVQSQSGGVEVSRGNE